MPSPPEPAARFRDCNSSIDPRGTPESLAQFHRHGWINATNCRVRRRYASHEYLDAHRAAPVLEGLMFRVSSVGQVECEFRPVDRKWVKHLMNWAVWYYDGDDFPVLQAVYPDLENRFPEDNEFDRSFEQPLMQPTASMARAENDFWASTDPLSSLFNWKFPDPPHTAVYLSATVHNGAEPVTYVSHDTDDGAWQFLGDSMSDGGGPVVSCFHHPIDRDISLLELADLPLGWYAERASVGEPWIRRKRMPDGASD
jgi:hypothetical protein